MTRLLALLVMLAGTACTDRADRERVPLSGEAAAAWHERGRKIYNFRCYFCHGYSGNARTLAATYLDRPPSDFTVLRPDVASPAAFREAIANGRADTAMKAFRGILSEQDIAAVADFVHREFVLTKAPNTQYHTAQNGWPDHARYRVAFPFVTGVIALDRAIDDLTMDERHGRDLYMRACISCHDRGRPTSSGTTWAAVSPDATAEESEEYRPLPSAGVNPTTPHDHPPRLNALSAMERRGEKLYQANCALCHAADGTGKNWMGRFLTPHPPDLTAAAVMSAITHKRMHAVIRDGLRETSMPAWGAVLSPSEIDAVSAYIHRAFHPLRDDDTHGKSVEPESCDSRPGLVQRPQWEDRPARASDTR